MSAAQTVLLSETRRRLLKTVAFTLAAACVPISLTTAVANTRVFANLGTDLLVTLAHTLFPHPFVTDGQLRQSVDMLAAKAAKDPALLTEVVDLLAELPKDFSTLDQPAREAALRGTTAGAVLMSLRAAAVNTIYHDPDVWKAIGYPGPSAPFGGYINKTLVDIDWLPNIETGA